MAIIKHWYPNLTIEFSPWERGKAMAIREMELDSYLKDMPKSNRIIIETKVYVKKRKKKKRSG